MANELNGVNGVKIDRPAGMTKKEFAAQVLGNLPEGTEISKNTRTPKEPINFKIDQTKLEELKKAHEETKAKREEALSKLSQEEREEYNNLLFTANSRSYNTVIEKVKEWNAKHPELPIKSQYSAISGDAVYNISSALDMKM